MTALPQGENTCQIDVGTACYSPPLFWLDTR
jgi:hypothetical protein